MIGKRCAHAVAEQRDDVARDGGAKRRMRGEVAEHGSEIEEAGGDPCRIVAARRARCARTSRASGSETAIGTAVLVDAARVAHPPRDRQREMRERCAGREAVAHRAEQPLRQLLRSVHRDLLRAVRQRADCGSASTQLPAVRGEIDRRAARTSVGTISSVISALDQRCEMRVATTPAR